MELEDVFKGVEGCTSHNCLIHRRAGMGTNTTCVCHLDGLKMNIIMTRLWTYRYINEYENLPHKNGEDDQ